MPRRTPTATTWTPRTSRSCRTPWCLPSLPPARPPISPTPSRRTYRRCSSPRSPRWRSQVRASRRGIRHQAVPDPQPALSPARLGSGAALKLKGLGMSTALPQRPPQTAMEFQARSGSPQHSREQVGRAQGPSHPPHPAHSPGQPAWLLVAARQKAARAARPLAPCSGPQPQLLRLRTDTRPCNRRPLQRAGRPPRSCVQQLAAGPPQKHPLADPRPRCCTQHRPTATRCCPPTTPQVRPRLGGLSPATASTTSSATGSTSMWTPG
jgi:hypothetical protein